MLIVNTELKYGHYYRDRFSKFGGYASAIYAYGNGCVRVELAGADKDSMPIYRSFDEQQVELVEDVEPIILELIPTGGPQDNEAVPR